MLVPRRHLACLPAIRDVSISLPAGALSDGQRDGPAKSEKGSTDRRLYEVPVAISNNKTVVNGGINKSAAAAASPVGHACCGGSLEGEIRYGRTGQRFNYPARRPGNTDSA